MSDPGSPLTPAQDEAVRAHLAAARHTDPVPPDVVARLDATLASLRDERLAAGPAEGAPVVSLASRRRRTLATALLGAAAAVAVAVGLGQVLPGGLGSGSDSQTASESSAGDSTSSLGESATDDQSAAEEGARAYDSDRAPKAQRKGDQPLPSPTGAAAAAGPELTSAKALAPQLLPLWRAHLLASSLSPPPTPRCPVAGVADADQRDALYNGSPATLVFPDPESGIRIDLYLCGADEPLRSVRRSLP